jgi:CheY-like chemotaxis protein
MSSIHYEQAQVLVFDPVRENSQTTRFTLHQLGFREIESISTIQELHSVLEHNAPHLLLMETGEVEDDVFEVVRRVRYGEMTENPFLSILLMGWKREADYIRQCISSGADDLILRPFSTKFIEDRIKSVAKARKPFIVTSDYTGPDRRQDKNRKSTIIPIKAPNILQAVLADDIEEMMKQLALVKDVFNHVQAERLKRLCMRLIIGSEAALSELEDGREPNVDVAEFVRSAGVLRRQLERLRSPAASKISAALCDGVSDLKKPTGLSLANFGNIKELSVAVYAAYSGGDRLERSADEIANAAAALRKRMAAVKDALSAKQQSNASADEAGGLRRAV